MSNRILSLAVVALVLAGCSTPNDQLCMTQQKCNQLGDQTVTQCEQDHDKCIQQWMNGNAACSQFATKYNQFASCGATLSCSDLEIQNVGSSSCSDQWNAVINAIPSIVSAGCPSCSFSASDGGS